jgi:hypothetical protein
VELAAPELGWKKGLRRREAMKFLFMILLQHPSLMNAMTNWEYKEKETTLTQGKQLQGIQSNRKLERIRVFILKNSTP